MSILIMLAVVLTLALVVAGVGSYAYIRIKGKMRSFARETFGTDTLKEGFEKLDREYASTPKSLSSGEAIYLPQIAKDFPNWNYDEMRNRAKNLLYSYINAIDKKEVKDLTEKTEELVERVEAKIQALDMQGRCAHHDDAKVHQVCLHRYIKERGRCSIIFQGNIEYFYYEEKDGKIVVGKKNLKRQDRYNIELVYIQDRALIEKGTDFALGINCPNCGAPISGVGAKVCKYCGSGIKEINIQAWHFTRVDLS